ncbi:MAG: dTDP-glucose 4,6-dehydratase [Parvibaculaceae bacterium]|nr:dTDP-glucose 4,6-dehydratase [Parvibaculaceae bacterium]
MRILLTGGCGFIGSAVVRHLIQHTDHSVLNVDKMTYAASQDALEGAENLSRYSHVEADIADRAAIQNVFDTFRPDRVMHLAAESHVDRSIDGPEDFIQTNIVGTYTLLQGALGYWRKLPDDTRKSFRFHHISTDEVFGALKPGDPAFTEETAYDPRSPYSASKAASDHLVRAWHHTYGLPVIVSNTTNNYGPWQFPDKLIPLVTLNALSGQPIPVYGDGLNQRDWIYVDDHAEALVRIIESGMPGNTYAISARQPCSNIDVVRNICTILDKLLPDPAGPREHLIRFVTDRPGHDFRYEVNPSRAEQALGWRAKHDFETGLQRTVEWYLQNASWWQNIRANSYDGARLGSAA